jgi:hypothetical protein
MKRSIFLLALVIFAGLTVFASAQWQAQPQIDPRYGPIYPVNPTYNFHSASNYNPFQFNWASGQWDYAPIQGGSSTSSPGEPAPAPGPVPYMPYGWSQQSHQTLSPAHTVEPEPSDTTPPAKPSPDDTELWSAPATRPEPKIAPQIVKFEGRIVAIKAVALAGEPTPHLLLRVRNDAGATGTIDAGQRLAFPDTAFDPGAKGNVSVTGQLGLLDGHLLLFADQIVFGSQTITIDRLGKSPGK